MSQESNADFWSKVKLGDALVLSDAATIKQRMAAGNGPTPENGQVQALMTVTNKLATWRFFALDAALQRWLMAKVVDSKLALALYAQNMEWDPSTRGEILGTERDFIFVPPANLDPEKGFTGDPDSLNYVGDISHENAGGNGTRVTYLQKPQGEQNGNISFQPARTGVNNWVATLVEYAADKPSDESELLILEAGEPEQGVIKMYIGRTLDPADVKVVSK